MERSEYPMAWARLWLAELSVRWSLPPAVMAEETVRRAVERRYDGGWAEMERTALGDYDAGCRA